MQIRTHTHSVRNECAGRLIYRHLQMNEQPPPSPPFTTTNWWFYLYFFFVYRRSSMKVKTRILKCVACFWHTKLCAGTFNPFNMSIDSIIISVVSSEPENRPIKLTNEMVLSESRLFIEEGMRLFLSLILCSTLDWCSNACDADAMRLQWKKFAISFSNPSNSAQ